MAFSMPRPGFFLSSDPTLAATPRPAYRLPYRPVPASVTGYASKPLPWSPNQMASFLNSELTSPVSMKQIEGLTRARGANFHAQVVAKLEQHLVTRSLPSRVIANLAAVGQRLAPQLARVATNPYVLGAVGLAVLGGLAYYWWSNRSPAVGKVVEEQAQLIGVPASAVYEFAKTRTPHFHLPRPNLPPGAMPGEALPRF